MKYPKSPIPGREYESSSVQPMLLRAAQRREAGDPPEDSASCDHRTSAPGRPLRKGNFCSECGLPLRESVEEGEARERYIERLRESLSAKRRSYHSGSEPKR